MSTKPRLCEILGVEVDQEFIIKGFKDSRWEGVYHIDSDGDFINDDESKDGRSCIVGYALCYAIRHPEKIVRSARWAEKDRIDAKAARQLFGDCVTAIERGKNHVYLRTPTETIAMLPDSAFPNVKAGDSIDLDEILEEENPEEERKDE